MFENAACDTLMQTVYEKYDFVHSHQMSLIIPVELDETLSVTFSLDGSNHQISWSDEIPWFLLPDARIAQSGNTNVSDDALFSSSIGYPFDDIKSQYSLKSMKTEIQHWRNKNMLLRIESACYELSLMEADCLTLLKYATSYRRFERMRRRRVQAYPFRFLSQIGQDHWVVQEVFGGKRGGTFVEIGAANGITLSNTVSLERHFAWGGLCIEPSKQSIILHQNRPNCVV